MRRADLALPMMIVGLSLSPLLADELLLQDGTRLQGTLKGGSLELETAQGRAQIPFASLERLDIDSEGRLHLLLRDRTSLEGALTSDSLVLNQGLFDRRVPVSQVRSATWEAPKSRLPAGTGVMLQMAGSASSRDSAETLLQFCVVDAVNVNGEAVIAKAAPAVGQVLGTGSGSNATGGGKLAIRAQKVLARDGSWLSLNGVLQVEAGFNPSRLSGGLLPGLAGSGDVAVASAGSIFEAKTESDAEIALAGTPPTPDQLVALEKCADFYRFSSTDEIPVDQMRPKSFYAPRVQPLRASVPLRAYLSDLDSKATVAHDIPSMRYLAVDGVSLSSFRVELTADRKGRATIGIGTTVAVAPSHDRWVRLKVDLGTGERTLKTSVADHIDAEERKATPVEIRLFLSPAEVAELRSAKDPRLHLTMTAIDN